MFGLEKCIILSRIIPFGSANVNINNKSPNFILLLLAFKQNFENYANNMPTTLQFLSRCLKIGLIH